MHRKNKIENQIRYKAHSAIRVGYLTILRRTLAALPTII